MPPATIPNLIDDLTGGHLTLLPTATAARSLRQAYDAAQRARSLTAWEPAPVLSWSQFLDRLWSEAVVNGLETRLLLNPAQEHTLWIDSIASKQAENTLTSTDALAALAHSAWSLANAYNAAKRLRATAATHDARTFALWAEAFEKTCDRNAYLSRAALEPALQHHIEARTLTAPPHLTLAGFPDLNPAQCNLLEALRIAGTEITELALEALPSPEPTRAILTAQTEQQELEAIAHWLRSFIQRRHQAGQTSSIAILLPNANDAPALESTFRQILAPELQPITADLSSTPYEFTADQPLTSHPLIATALDLAHWAQAPLELGNVSALLLSPYLTASSELDAAAQFDANILRQAPLLRPEIDLRAILHLTTTITISWLQPLNQYLTKSGNLETPRTYADWAEFFRALLAAASWPANAETLTAREFHATQTWDSLLDQLSTLDFRGLRIPYTAFLQTLTRQASTTAFQPPSTNAPIQILSPSAAIGLTFDALILPRATDTSFPPPEHPNPLLSWPLQASLDMPGTSQTRATARARQSLTALLAAAPNILFTYAAQTPEGPQRLAPSLAALNWPQLDVPTTPPHSPIEEDLIPDAPPLPPLPNTHVRGGAKVLQLQAACGFRAFAEMRLNATEPGARDLGFDARETGNLLHRAMDNFWAVARSQTNLRNMTAQQRDDLLSQSIQRAIDRSSRDLPLAGDWDRAYIAIQAERLHRLLHHWLDVELKRSGFTVQQVEKQKLLTVGPLTLTLRIDRIDAIDTPDGGVLIADYKSGSTGNPADWLGPRPDEPQLPLYALLPEAGQLKGLAFAKVRAGKEMKWLGYQSEPGLLPSKKTAPLPALIAEWRSTLTALAQDFAAGDARVDPKDYPSTCAHCTQRILCRLDPASLRATADTGDEEAEEDSADA